MIQGPIRLGGGVRPLPRSEPVWRPTALPKEATARAGSIFYESSHTTNEGYVRYGVCGAPEAPG
jgi:hypothetical protein